MLLTIDGQGIVKRDTKKTEIRVPDQFYPGDVISIKKGSAIILLFSGEEVIINNGKSYTIPEDANSNTELYNIANNDKANQSLFAPSAMAHSVRGPYAVFPMNSKILNDERVTLQFGYENTSKLALHLKVYDSKNQKLVFEQKNIANPTISLNPELFTEGKSYHWQLLNTPKGNLETGSIVMPSKIENDKFSKQLNPQSHADYLSLISSLYENKYKFAAYYYAADAAEKYPDIKAYSVLIEIMKGTYKN